MEVVLGYAVVVRRSCEEAHPDGINDGRLAAVVLSHQHRGARSEVNAKRAVRVVALLPSRAEDAKVLGTQMSQVHTFPRAARVHP